VQTRLGHPGLSVLSGLSGWKRFPAKWTTRSVTSPGDEPWTGMFAPYIHPPTPRRDSVMARDFKNRRAIRARKAKERRASRRRGDECLDREDCPFSGKSSRRANRIVAIIEDYDDVGGCVGMHFRIRVVYRRYRARWSFLGASRRA